MLKLKRIIILFILLISTSLFAGDLLLVGVYQNAPLNYLDGNTPRGFFVDLAKDWALASGYELSFVYGEFPDLLEKIKNNEIDLLLNVAKSPEREEFMAFNNTPLFTNHGVVIVKNTSNIVSIQQLSDKKIGVLVKDIHETFLDKFLTTENVIVKKVYYRSYEEIVNSIMAGNIDAGLLNYSLSTYYLNNGRGLKMVIEKLGSVDLYIGLSKKRQGLKASLDNFFQKQLKDKESTYYSVLEKWFGEYLTPSISEKKAKRLLTVGIIIIGISTLGALTAVFSYRIIKSKLHKSEIHVEELNKLLLDAVATFAEMNPNVSDRIFFEKLLDLALEFIPEADSGCVSVISDGFWKFRAVRGYDSSLYDLKIPAEYMINAKEKAIVVKNISDYNKKELPEKYQKAFIKAGASEIKVSLMVGYYVNGEYLGNISLDTKKDTEFSESSRIKLEYLGKIASQFFRMRQVTELENQAKEEVIYALVRALETGDPYTSGHSVRVANYAIMLGKRLNLNEDELNTLKWAALLHDIGKIGVPREILLKTGKLNAYELQIIREHVKTGVDMLKNFRSLKKMIPIIAAHHERWDGKGYPEGLKGEEIPLLSRILSIVDAYDAMRSNRPYRAPISFEEALEEIIKNAGTQFDPQIARIFVEYVHEIDLTHFKEDTLRKS
ncbi:MAG: transporter substrate-binding domain-containing protein [Kosmotoga sp.]|uniref:HD domain-containing phosphohydrolase n=1 Tax=Kosmotoga sp. TaxID=1955248 RepID=UPI001D1F8AE8|nr:HD domain-containing phosphohydrolase [Kosmotoga sp.]MBO8166406.1 transporter substrate-binding domain-containing protein [Kosmotoga sp.]